MLVLCSNGLTSENVISSLRPYTQGYKTAALVVTADNIYKEKNYHVGRCVAELESLSLSVDITDIDKSPAEALLSYDVVSFINRQNGSTFAKMTGLLEPWEEMAQKYRNGEISREECDQWRYRYPRSEAERNEAKRKEKKGE